MRRSKALSVRQCHPTETKTMALIWRLICYQGSTWRMTDQVHRVDWAISIIRTAKFKRALKLPCCSILPIEQWLGIWTSLNPLGSTWYSSRPRWNGCKSKSKYRQANLVVPCRRLWPVFNARHLKSKENCKTLHSFQVWVTSKRSSNISSNCRTHLIWRSKIKQRQEQM